MDKFVTFAFGFAIICMGLMSLAFAYTIVFH